MVIVGKPFNTYLWAALAMAKGVLTYTQSKTGKTVALPIHPDLLAHLETIAVSDVPQKFVAWVMSFGTDRTAVILLMLVIWIIAGMFMETGPCIVILGPLLWPLAQKVGIDQIHFCVYMITTLGLGFITPPFGLNLFVMAGLTRTPLTMIARVIPCTCVSLIVFGPLLIDVI